MLQQELIELVNRIHQFKAEVQNLEVKSAHIDCPKKLFDTLSSFSNQDIAKALFVSEKTVKNHLTNIFRKLNVNDRTQALIYVLKHKIVSLE